MAVPVTSSPEKPCQAPSTVSTPMKPRPSPATRRRVGRSSESATSESAMPHSGEVALQMPGERGRDGQLGVREERERQRVEEERRHVR